MITSTADRFNVDYGASDQSGQNKSSQNRVAETSWLRLILQDVGQRRSHVDRQINGAHRISCLLTGLDKTNIN